VDRVRASSNLVSALITAAIAVGLFGLTFFVAIVYIG
jgi:hypothetical protein